MRNFRNLEVWTEAIEFVRMVYQLTSGFPTSEKYALCNQMHRAAISIPSNIAEGCSRSSSNEFARFLEISLGSAFELETQIEIAYRNQYLSTEFYACNLAKLNTLQRRINSLREAIR
jgi:four helix bundle protein